MKNLKKLAIILLVVLLGVTMVANSVCATDWKSTTQFDSNNNDSLDSATRNIVGAIVSVIRIVGTGIALIMLVAVAIKYMSSAPGDRAEIKKHAVIYVVGAIVLFGGAQLIGIIQNFASNISA
ncbi:MAG: hypothetical protein K1W33_01335 [Clostridia bacterium]